MCIIRLGSDATEFLAISILCRAHPACTDYWDGNWLACELHISAGGFRGAFRADLRSEEFQTFLDEAEALSRALDGVASFSTMEEQIAFTLTGDGRGHVRVEGKAFDAPGSDNHLHFIFDIDQTYLPEICRSLGVVLAAFPVVGTTDA